ncbi:MAG: FkbM family methyltransferase [Gammaproteobacteria bacterium]|nr:FkbM family methyltransferase [Gammaproteobacteria bacterium]
MNHLFKTIAARLPFNVQHELKRCYFRSLIAKNKFVTNEPEFQQLDSMISAGDWVIDIGANIGHYTKRFSDIVGASGRVFAFEPVVATFCLLTENARGFKCKNVTLLNVAASENTAETGVSIPQFDTGLMNYYQARLTKDSNSDVKAMTLSLDSLNINNKISLVKIDAEGHEKSVIRGMTKLIENCHPTLIVETSDYDLIAELNSFGYKHERLEGSPNIIFKYLN